MVNELLIGNINMEGFQVIHGVYFQRQQAPQMTLWKDAVQFNQTAYSMLSKCESVKMLLNAKSRQILVQPCLSKDPNSIAWLKNPDDPKTMKLLCEQFTRQLFDAWGLETAYHYRAYGTLVQSDERLMLLFDFQKPEVWNGLKLVKEDK